MEGPSADASSTTGEGAARRVVPPTTIKPCANCRRRKVRCDKNEPCANCVRSGNRCVYEGSGRNDETGLLRDAAAAAELRERVSRLENLIENLAGMNVRDPSNPQRVGVATELPPSGVLTAPRSEASDTNQTLGREIFDSVSSVYIDTSAWSELFERIENLQYWLAPSGPSPAPSNPIQSAFVFSFGPDAPPSDPEFYPSIKQSELICKIFWRIVEPFIKVLHRPKFAKDLELYRRQACPYQTDFEALLFVIHALTIAVLPSDIVFQAFGERKDEMLQTFQLEAEKALARANFLRSRSELCFQAYLYYITFLYECGRYDDASSLTGLALRFAQRLGIQYDPANYNYSPWNAEIRRRMWNYMIQLDFRALTLCAAEPGTSTTAEREPQPPKNLDDSDWEPCRFAKNIAERSSAPGFRETTFVILRRQFTNLYRRITQTGLPFEAAQAMLSQARATIQQNYLVQFNSAHPLHLLVSALVRQQFSLLDIISRQIYLKQYKKSVRNGSAGSIHPTTAPKPNTFRHSLFLSSLLHLEETSRMEVEFSRYKWQWIIRDPVPWHAIARVLTDLCHWFEGPEVERAWKQIDLVWERYNDDNGGLINTPIFQPLRSMREQAQFRLEKYRIGETDPDEEGHHSDVSGPQEYPPPPLGQQPEVFPGTTFAPDFAMQDLTVVSQAPFYDIYAAPSGNPERGELVDVPYGHGFGEEHGSWSTDSRRQGSFSP